MTIKARDRKLLWGRSGMLCALCKRPLSRRSASNRDHDVLIGEEAHIVGQGARGPRAGSIRESEIDGYDNLILLCANDHTMIDKHTGSYPTERLLQIKSAHETWVTERLDRREGASARTEPIRLRAVKPGHPIPLPRLESGREAWNVVVGSMSYRFESPEEGPASVLACDTADEFLQEMSDCGEISEHIVDAGRRAIRDAERSLASSLSRLKEQGLCAFGAQRSMLLSGGGELPSAWREAIVIVRLASEVADVDPLIAVVADEIFRPV